MEDDGHDDPSWQALQRLRPSGAEIVHEPGGWSVFIPGLPVAADGVTMDDAMDEMVTALREYADDWKDHLWQATNRAERARLVQLIDLSTDADLTTWLNPRSD
jgi:hypothetical protein